MTDRQHHVDPDPFTIIAAVTGVISAATGAIAIWQSARPPPSKIRRSLLTLVNDLDDKLLHLDTDLKQIEGLFDRAEFPRGRYVRLGNGARLSAADFSTYERAADRIFTGLRKVYKSVLKLEKLASATKFIDDHTSAKFADEFNVRLERLLSTRDLSVDASWDILREALHNVQKLCAAVRKELL